MRRVIFIDLSLRKLLRWCSRSAIFGPGNRNITMGWNLFRRHRWELHVTKRNPRFSIIRMTHLVPENFMGAHPNQTVG